MILVAYDDSMINAIIDILTIVAIFWFWDRYLKALTGKGLWDRYLQQVMPKRDTDDSQYLFELLCRQTDKKPIEIFKIARTEMGFGWCDEQVKKHLETYVGGGCKELPNYVEAFVDKGKEYILRKE